MNRDEDAEAPNIKASCRREPGNRILVVTAVPIERDAVLRGLQNDIRFDVLAGGVGPAAAAASTARALAATEYCLVVSAGIAGGFPGRAEVGTLVVANEIAAADLGVESPQGFSSLDELGFGSTRIQIDEGMVKRVSKALLTSGLQVNIGPVITVSTVTGTFASAEEMTVRVPGAAAEAMEGYGVAVASRDRDIPILEIRAISNLVGPRDRNAWRIKEALDLLQTASSVLLEVLP